MTEKTFESILNEEQDIRVMRMLALSGWKQIQDLREEVSHLREIEYQKNQLKLEIEYQRTMFQKLIFGSGQERRQPDRHRRLKEDQQLLVHSQSLVPAPSPDEVKALDCQATIHEMSVEELLEESKLRGFPEDATQWEEIKGLTEDSTEVTVIERKYILEKHKRKKYRYKPSKNESEEKQVIVTAPGPEKLLPGCSYSIDFGLSVVRDKYEYHMPLERQTRVMEALGLGGMGTKTLWNMCQAVATHLEPVVEEIRKDIFACNRTVHLDETPWPIYGKDDNGYMWALSNQVGSVYRFEPTRSGKVAEEMLEGYAGPMLTDAYNGYDRFKKRKGIILAHCWAHGRRKFFDIRDLYPECEEVLDMMEKLFGFEHEARSLDELAVIRKEKSASKVDEIKKWLLERKSRHLPESAFTRAVDYILKRWKEFTVFLTDARIPLSNNDAERAIRHAVMGRKNFYGSKTINGADVAAILYTVIESCKKMELDPTLFIKQAILRNNHGEEQISPLAYARQLRQQAA